MPARGIRGRLLAASALALLLGGGCQSMNTPVYFAAPDPLETGGNDDMGNPRPPGQGTVTLLFRQPNDKERAILNGQRDKLGFDVPWLQRDRLHVELLYTIKNIDTAPGVFTVFVDGATEYTRYDEAAIAAAFTAGGQDPVLLPLLRSGPQMLAPGATYQGSLREDDFVEASLDLDAMGRWMASFASVLINRSDVNPVGLDMVPPGLIVPAMYEFTLSFSADRHMTCNFLVRVRDDDGRLYQTGDGAMFTPAPTAYVPMLPPPP
jgi:hypothetical protein